MEKIEVITNSGNELQEEETVNKTYPLGVLKAWTTLVGAAILQMCAAGPITAFGVFQDFYTTNWLKSFSASNISWIGSVELFIGLGFGFVGGRLYDSGNGRITLIAGSLLFTFCLFMLSLSKENQYYQVFLSQGVGMGLGYCLIFSPTCTLVSHHFRSRKALAMGILVSMGPFGGIIFSVMINQLIHSSIGFKWGVRISAFVTGGLFVLGNLLISVPPPIYDRTERKKGNPQLREWPYILVLLCGFVGQLGAYYPIFFVQLFARTHDISDELSFYSLTILNASCILGRTIPNYFADQYGAINIFIIAVASYGLVGFAMLGAGSVTGLVLYCVFIGFFFGATVSLYLPVVATLEPREADMGRTMGLALAPVGIASLIGSPIAGALLSNGSTLTWWKGITFSSVCVASSSVLVVIARHIHNRKSTPVGHAGEGENKTCNM